MNNDGTTPRTPFIAVVADDSRLCRTMLCDYLTDAGFGVHAFSGGKDALAAVKEHQPDIVLLDVQMPDMDGFAVCKALKADPATRDLPVIFVTGAENVDQKVKGFQVGGADYVFKSSPEQEVVARALTHARMARLQTKLRKSHDELTARAAALTESENRLRAIVDTAADGIITIDARGIIESFNQAAEKITGYTADEVIGRDVAILVPESMVDQHRAGLKRYVETGRAKLLGLSVEVPGRRKDGSEVPLSLSLSEFHVGSRQMFAGMVRDISERKQAEADLKNVYQQLMDASRRAGMAEIATSVLHNVGNVLNSVNVSASLVAEKVRKSKISGLAKATELMQQHDEDLGTFLTESEKGKMLPGYLARLAKHLTDEQGVILKETGALTKKIEHLKTIVSAQQASAGAFGVVESVSVTDLAEDAITVNGTSFEQDGIRLVREYSDVPPVSIDRQKLLQIMINLIRNAKQAVLEGKMEDKRLTLRIGTSGNDQMRIEVIDNGVGISQENITRIFAHGFTTKTDGHGFGLHSSALAAKDLGGSVTVQSDGPEQGATFTLELPLEAAEVTQ